MNQIQMAKNPQLALNEMLVNNPQAKAAIEYVKANGGDSKTAFLRYVQQLGIDPQQIINQLKTYLPR